MREYVSVPAEDEGNPLDGVYFTLDGVRFDCKGHLSVAEMAELARQAMSGEEMAEAAQIALIAEPLAQAFGPEEYARFRLHVREHHTPDSVYMQILADLQEEIKAAVQRLTGRPTEPSSPSGPGGPATGERISRVVSFQDGDVKVIPLPAAQDHKPPARTRQGDGGRPRTKRTG